MGAEPQSRVSVTHVEEAVIPEKMIARSGRAFSPKGNKNKSSHPQGRPGARPRLRDQVFAWEEADAEPEVLGYGLPCENRNSTADATKGEEAGDADVTAACGLASPQEGRLQRPDPASQGGQLQPGETAMAPQLGWELRKASGQARREVCSADHQPLHWPGKGRSSRPIAGETSTPNTTSPATSSSKKAEQRAGIRQGATAGGGGGRWPVSARPGEGPVPQLA